MDIAPQHTTAESAGETPDEQLEIWLRQESILATKWPAPDGVAVSWSVRHAAPVDFVDDSAALEPYLRGAHFVLRSQGPRLWRLSTDSADTSVAVPFVDQVLTANLAWKLTPYWLVLLDPHLPFPKGHQIAEAGRRAAAEVALLRFGGFQFATGLGLQIESVCKNGSEWSCHWSAEATNASVTLSGRWHPDLNRGFVESMELFSEDITTSTWRFGGWTFNDTFGAFVAATVERYGPKGESISTIAFDSATPEPLEQMSTMTAPMDFGGHDVLRGTVGLESISDFRLNPPVERFRTVNGIAQYDHVQLDQFSKLNAWNFRLLGWSVSGIVVIALVFAATFAGKRIAGTS